MQRSLLLLGLAAATIVVACAPSDAPAPAGPTVTVVDGVRIVENAAPAWSASEGWRISPEPTLTLGVDVGEPHEMLANPRRPLRLSDGRIVIADDSHELKYFNADGNYLYPRSGPGQGPGEFVTIGSPLRMPNDGLLIDNLNGPPGMHAFDSGGAYTATIVLQDHGLSYSRARVFGVFGDGSLLARASVRPFERFAEGEIGWRMIGLFRYLPDGTQPHHLGDFPSSESTAGEAQYIFNARGIVATHSDGFLFTDGRSAEIQVYDLEGALRQKILWPAEPEPVTAALRDAWIAASRANIEQYGGDPRAEQRLTTVLFAETIPLVRSMLVDDVGNIWAHRHAGLGHTQLIRYRNSEPVMPSSSDWEVFTPDGAWLGTVSLPPTQYPGHFGDDFILTAGQDDTGVEHVWLYELIKP